MTDTLVERLERAMRTVDDEWPTATVQKADLCELLAERKAQASRIAELEGAIVLASARMADLAVLIQPRHAPTIARWADELRKALEDKTLSNGGGE